MAQQSQADNITQFMKVPPQAIEAEQSVLGGLMLDNQRFDDVVDIVKADDFYTHTHQVIFDAILSIQADNKPVDLVTVRELLDNREKLESIGGLAYLDQLVRNTPSTANLVTYANIIRDRSILRQLINAGNKIIEQAYSPNDMLPREILDQAEQIVFDIAEKQLAGTSTFRSAKEMAKIVADKIDELFENKGALSGLDTGFTDLNEITSGLQRSDLIIVAGRPAMGKTSFAMNLVENIVHKDNLPVAVFSLEMPAEQLIMRFLSSLSQVSVKNIRSGNLTQADMDALASSTRILSKLPIHIDDTPGINVLEIRSRARRLARGLDTPLGLIVIDYLQLMQATTSSDNRVAELSVMTRSLKMLAKELNVPVVVLSQLSRNPEQRPNKRPIMSDLRESGAIEQDADVILFVYRDEVYNEDSPDKGTAELIIGKQRNGPIGMVRLTFRGEFTRFENFSPHFTPPDF